MEIKKINVDRKPLGTEYIQSKQDFQHVLANYKKAHIPVFKQPLFYGVIGFATIAALISVSIINFNSSKNEEIITSKINKEISKPTEHVKVAILKSNITLPEGSFKVTAPVSKNETQRAVEKSSIVIETPAEKEIQLKSEKKVSPTPSNFPHISGISEGDISFSELCNGDGIQLRNGSEIVGFKFQYVSGGSDKIISVSGNKVPAAVCSEMTKSGIEQLVFITDIEAMSGKGIVHVPNMNLWVSNKG